MIRMLVVHRFLPTATVHPGLGGGGPDTGTAVGAQPVAVGLAALVV